MTHYKDNKSTQRRLLTHLRTATEQAVEQCAADGLKPGVALLQAALELPGSRLRDMLQQGDGAILDLVALLASNIEHLQLPVSLQNVRRRLHQELTAHQCPPLQFAIWVAPPSLAMSGRRFQRYRELHSGSTDGIAPDVRQGRKVRRLRAGVHAVLSPGGGELPALLVGHLLPGGIAALAAVLLQDAECEPVLDQREPKDRLQALLPAMLGALVLHGTDEQWDWSLDHRLPSVAFLRLCNWSAAISPDRPNYRGRFASARLLSGRLVDELMARDKLLFTDGGAAQAQKSWLVSYARRDPAFLSELAELAREATRLFARQRMERLEDPEGGAADVMAGASLDADGGIPGCDETALQQEPLALLGLHQSRHPVADDLPAASPIRAGLTWAAEANDADAATEVEDRWVALLQERRWFALADEYLENAGPERYTLAASAALLTVIEPGLRDRTLDSLNLSAGSVAHLRKRLRIGKSATLTDLARAYLDRYPETPAEGSAKALQAALQSVLPTLRTSRLEGLESIERDAETLDSGLADLADLLS